MTSVQGRDSILVADNDSHAREQLCNHLSQEGYEVFEAVDGVSLSQILHSRSIALIVVGLQMSNEDGPSTCLQLRAAGVHIPIIILSTKVQDTDRIAGLSAGADDYVCKPFNPREVRARIRSILWRIRPKEVPGGPSSGNEIFRFGSFEFNLGVRALWKEGQLVSITTVQFAILKALVRHAGQPLSREKLALTACGREYGVFERSLDVNISRIRKLLEDGSVSYIKTVWGVGYMFEPGGKGDAICRHQ